MKKNSLKLIGLVIVMFCLILGNVYAQKFPENPKQDDPYKELMRLRNEGIAHYENGITLKGALAAFESALALNPDSAVEHYNLGVIHRKFGKNDLAKPFLQKAIALDENLAHPYYTLGLIYKNEGNHLEARKMFEKAKALAPSDAHVYHHLSRLYRYEGNNQLSLQSLIHALQLDSYHTGALFDLYQYYLQQNEHDRAKEVLQEFNRLKQAAKGSRKESKDDDSVLSMPIGSTNSDVGNQTNPDRFQAILIPEVIRSAARVTAFDLKDIDDDGDGDLILATAKNQIVISLNQGNGTFETPRVWQAKMDFDIQFLLAEKFVLTEKFTKKEKVAEKESFRLLIFGKEGIAISQGDLKSGNQEWRTLSEQDGATVVFDLDHDGDLDLAGSPFDKPWVNRGNADFYQDEAFLSTPAIRDKLNDATGIVASDFGNSGGADLLVYNKKGERHLLRDARGGLYKLVEGPLVTITGLQWVGKGDMDNDGLIDIVSLNGHQLFIDFNQGRYRFEHKLIGNFPKKEVTVTRVIADYDNDGLKDIMIFQQGQPPLLWLNIGQRQFNSVVLEVAPVPSLKNAPIADDIDSDGKLDLLALSTDGKIMMFHNDSIGVGNWMKVSLQGVRSPSSGTLTQLEVRKGAWYSKYESSGRTIHLGLGKENYVEILRITWPNGFVENKFKVDAKNRWSFEESERIAGSCPTVFTWNGDRFEFVTDAFISGPMGVPLQRGMYFPVDHDEYIKISGDQLQAQGGKYQIRITEELRETVYLDKVRLLAIDHPNEIDIYPNERLAPPPFPEFRIHGTAHARPPLQATDHHDNDVLALIEKVDGKSPSNIERSIYTGFSEPQGITMTLPEGAADSDHLRVFLTGWFYYFDSTSLISASQRKDLNIIWPHIQAFQNGKWEMITPIGIPPGKNKTLVVDLSGKLKAGTTQIRVWTNVELYWDRILIDTQPPRNDEYTLKETPLTKANVRFRGFSFPLKVDAGPQPERFDYHRVGYLALWNPMQGKYTRYGDVLPLLEKEESQMVVFGSGDEVVLEFDADAVPMPIDGESRDFLLYLNGYVKDGDKYTAHDGKVDPMPFAGMKQYPYSTENETELPFASPAYIQYLKDYQTRNPLHFVGPKLSEGSE